MQALNLNDPEKFVMADIVTKNSKTGITSNKRLLVIKKGHLYYYSSVPKNFKNQIKFLQSYHELPKCSIEILNIKKINGFESNSNYFSIEFEARHMMEREDIRKTMTLEEFNFAPKNKKQTITWQFTCDNQNVKQKWVTTLQSLQGHYSKEKVNIQKFFDNINKKQQQNSQPAIRSSLMVPWREDQIKKSSSNESLTKNLRNSQMNRSASPSNGKKSATSNSNSEKNQPRDPNKIKLLSPESEEDLVESFMKIEKTKSLHEPVEGLSIKQENQDASETPRQSNLEDFKNKIQSTPEVQEVHENLFGKKGVAELEVSKFQISQVKETTANFSEDAIQIEKEKKVESPIKQYAKETESSKNLLQPEPKKQPSIPKIESAPFEQTRFSPRIRKTISIQQRNPPFIKTASVQYRVDFNTNFYELLYFSQNRQYSFEKRIEAQKKLNTLLGNFTDKNVKSYIEFINSKANNPGNSSRFTEDKINQGLSTLQIGYSRFKIGYVTTQAIAINGKQKIFYNESTVKEIKRQMSIYNKLFSVITHHLKNMNKTNPLNTQASLSLSLSRSQAYSESEHHSTTSLNYPDIVYPGHLKVSVNQLRVPLCTYIEYKGICAMAYDQTYKNKQTQIEDKDKLNQWRDLLRFLGFNSACFDFKTIDTSVGQLVVVYVVSAGKDIYLNKKQEKHHNVTFHTPMNVEFIKKAKKQGASTSTQSLLRYLQGIQSLKQTQLFTCPREQITTTLQYCYLIKYLRKFYRASHAEIDQLKFINLLLKGDANMNKLFESSSFESQSAKPGGQVLGIFFEFLLYYLGINCIVDVENFSKYASLVQIGINKNTNRVNCVKQVKLVPRIIGYSLDGLQLYQSFSKIDYFISCKSKELANKALEYKQGTFFENFFQICSYPWPASCQCLFALAQLNYIENDYITSIAKCKQFLFTLLSTSDDEGDEQNNQQIPAPSCCIPIYFLMIKCYSKFSRDKFNQTLKLVIESTMFNYGQHSSMMITLFSFVALVFCGIGQYSQAETYLKIGIKQAERIYQLYSKSKLSELYLDLSRVLLQQSKIEQYNQYLSKTEKIVDSKGSQDEKINLLLYILETSVKMPKSIQWEQKAIQTLFRTEKILKKQQSNLAVVKQYYTLQYQIGMKYKKNSIYEKAIEELWRLDTSSKILSIEYCYRLVGHQFQELTSQYLSILEKWSLSKEKSLLKIEQNVKNYKNLLDMMTEVFTQEDEDLVSAFVKVLPEEVLIIKSTI